MSSFVSSSACRGQRPLGLVPSRLYEREHLIARLLKERRVARFVVAPDGFGKTALVFEYADVVFSFKHVFWFKCTSPCFIRDLDHAILLEEVLATDRKPSLVVLEDVPRFGPDRSRALSVFIDALLEVGSEVIVTCTPSNDAYTALHRDRLLLTGFDLLLEDFELRTHMAHGGLNAKRYHEIIPAERVACLRWGEAGDFDFAASIGREELPGDVSMALLAIMVLGQGSLASLSLFVAEKRLPEVLGLLEASYPHLGIDLAHGSFEAAHLSVEALASGCAPLFDRAARFSRFENRSALAGRFADALVSQGSFDRAVGIIASFSSRLHAQEWLINRGWDLLLGRAPYQAYWLFERLAKDPAHESGALCVLGAWAAYVLDDIPHAESLAKRVLLGRSVDDFDRVLSSFLLLKLEPNELRDRALNCMTLLISAGSVQSARVRHCELDLDIPLGDEAWKAYALLPLACARSAAEGAKTWLALRDSLLGQTARRAKHGVPRVASPETVLALAAMMVVGKACDGLHSPNFPTDHGEGGSLANVERPLSEVVAYLVDVIDEALAAQRGFGWLELEAAHSLHDLHVAAPHLLSASQLAFKDAPSLRSAQAEMLSMRASYARLRAEKERKVMEYNHTHPDPFRKDLRIMRPEASVLRSAHPTLRVKLFGSFEVKVGDVEVGFRLARQRKAKVLLAALVIGRGREMSRDYLASLLWPGSSPRAARKNFYAVWVALLRVLEVNGSCPYLIRDESGCRLDPRLLSCDVEEYEALCRYLLLGKVEDWEWRSLYLRLSDLCSQDLMPSEESNDYICRQRDRYRLNLTDALVFASGRLLQAGELQGSIWFAREAWQRDLRREDACMALMRAQAASGQRGSAIESFFTLKRCLADDLGIDPSPRIVELYGSILEPEAIPA